MHQRKGKKTLNQTSLCIKCGKFLRSLGTWSWDSRFAPYSSHLARSTGHCLGSSVCTCKDDLRLFIGETNRAVGTSVFPPYSSISESFARPLFSVNVTQPIKGKQIQQTQPSPHLLTLVTDRFTCAFLSIVSLCRKSGGARNLTAENCQPSK